MCSQAVSAIEASTTTQSAPKHRADASRSRPAPGSFGQRAVRAIGCGFLGLSTSTWILFDLSVLLVGVAYGYRIFPPPALEATPHIALWQASAVFAFAVTISSLVFGLYERDTLLSRSRIVTRTLLTVGTATIVAYALIYVVMYATVSRRVTGLTMASSLVIGVAVRLAACATIGRVPRGLIIVGGRSLFDSFRRAQDGGLLTEYRIAGYCTTPSQTPGPAKDRDYLGSITDQDQRFGPRGVTDIVVGADAAGGGDVMSWMVPSLQRGCRVTNEAIFYEKAAGQILVDEITPSWFLFADLRVHCDRQAMIKRTFDLVTAAVGLCLTAPLWPLIALAVKLCDGGPVFYYQDRVGHNGQVFRLYKFRTMRTDAENGKSVWASPNDPRVTAIGRWLRRSRLDELPQFYNVLVGRMSMVGPRPERPDIVEKLCREVPYYAERHLVKPGITGWAQISYHYGQNVEDAKRKLQFDLYYLKHMSFELDMTILLRTAGVFLKGGC